MFCQHLRKYLVNASRFRFESCKKLQLLDVLAISIKKVNNMIDRRSFYQSWTGIGNIPTGPTSHESRHSLSQSVIEAMQHQSLAEHGGLAGIRDQGVLESALARCKNKSAYDSQRGRCCGDVYLRGSGRSGEAESCQVVRGAFESETIASLSTSAGRSMPHASLSVYVSPMPSLDRGDEEHIIQDFINDAVVANADSIEVVRTEELFATGWAWRVSGRRWIPATIRARSCLVASRASSLLADGLMRIL